MNEVNKRLDPRGIIRQPFSMNLLVDSVEILSQTTVNIEPPVTDEVLLVEQGTIGTEEAVLGQPSLTISGTNVEWLAVSLNISIIASFNLEV